MKMADNAAFNLVASIDFVLYAFGSETKQFKVTIVASEVASLHSSAGVVI